MAADQTCHKVLNCGEQIWPGNVMGQHIQKSAERGGQRFIIQKYLVEMGRLPMGPPQAGGGKCHRTLREADYIVRVAFRPGRTAGVGLSGLDDKQSSLWNGDEALLLQYQAATFFHKPQAIRMVGVAGKGIINTFGAHYLNFAQGGLLNQAE